MADELFITLPDGRTMHHRLTGAPAVIGRDATCEITVDDPSTSRHHARFVPTARGYIVEDMGSRNGTFVNNERIEDEREIKQGDYLRIGKIEFSVHTHEDDTTRAIELAEDETRPNKELGKTIDSHEAADKALRDMLNRG